MQQCTLTIFPLYPSKLFVSCLQSVSKKLSETQITPSFTAVKIYETDFSPCCGGLNVTNAHFFLRKPEFVEFANEVIFQFLKVMTSLKNKNINIYLGQLIWYILIFKAKNNCNRDYRFSPRNHLGQHSAPSETRYQADFFTRCIYLNLIIACRKIFS